MTPTHPIPGESREPESGSPLDEAMAACRRALVTVGAFSFCINLLVLTVPVYMVQVFDRVMTSHSGDTLAVLTLAAFAAFVVMGLLEVVRSRILVRVGLWLDARLARPVFAAMVAGGGAPSAQGLRDLARVRGFLTGAGVFAVLDAPWVPVFVLLIFLLHPALGVAAVAGAGLLFALAWVNDATTRAPLKAANDAAVGTMAAADAMARQSPTVEGLGMAPALSRWWAVRNARALALQATASDRAGLIMAVSRSLRLALQVGLLGLAAWLVLHQQLTVGAMIAASIILARALAPVEQSIGVWRSVTAARAAFDRIRGLLANDPGDEARTPLPRPRGQVRVKGVSFLPEGAGNPVFRRVTMTATPGKMVAITGPCGAGKSTLAEMMVGIRVPDAGRVTLDGADVHAWPVAERGRHVGYVPQSAELLPGTVRDNIARFDPSAPAEAVIAAARLAGVHDRIMGLPSAYDTLVGGPADRLSAGARQQIALARALFGDPRLVVLDEPYSNLDAEGVLALMAAIDAMKARGAAVVMVAHRPSILAHADRVILLEGGGSRLVQRSRRVDLKLLTGGEAKPMSSTPPARRRRPREALQ